MAGGAQGPNAGKDGTDRHIQTPGRTSIASCGQKSYWAMKPILLEEFNESKLKILFWNKIVSQIKNRSSADRCKRLVSDVFIEAMTKVQQVSSCISSPASDNQPQTHNETRRHGRLPAISDCRRHGAVCRMYDDV